MKTLARNLFSVLLLFCAICLSALGSNDIIEPVTPKASPEAKALLKFLYSTSGKYILTGQHNFPNIKLRNTKFATEYIGKTPILFSTDWGFAKDSDTDSYLARPDIVSQSIQMHKQGAIITICWHAVPPTASEPITFRPRSGKISPDSLASVQGQLTDQQFKDLLTPGTNIYKKWCSQVDTIALYLKKLQDAHVPILWRPYHEMNGSWFWWGGRRGQYSTIALYHQLFDRLVKYHKLNNLIWVWSVDRPNNPNMYFSNYYPGNKYLDILALDVYGRDFKQAFYDSLLILSKGKLLTLAEVGSPPSPEIIKAQPKWSYYVIWAGMVRNTLKKEYNALLDDPKVLWFEDTVYWNASKLYRTECGLPLLSLQVIKQKNEIINFTGDWVFNEENSKLDFFGSNNVPYKMKIKQQGVNFDIQKTYVLEYIEDKVTNDKLTINGKEIKTEIMKQPATIKAILIDKSDTLYINSKTNLNWGEKPYEMDIEEKWTLDDNGKTISIKQTSNTPRGNRSIVLIFNKQ